jgi:hypothetical protein
VLDPDMHMEIRLHAIVVEQRIVNVEQEDRVVHHPVASRAGGSVSLVHS